MGGECKGRSLQVCEQSKINISPFIKAEHTTDVHEHKCTWVFV